MDTNNTNPGDIPSCLPTITLHPILAAAVGDDHLNTNS